MKKNAFVVFGLEYNNLKNSKNEANMDGTIWFFSMAIVDVTGRGRENIYIFFKENIELSFME